MYDTHYKIQARNGISYLCDMESEQSSLIPLSTLIYYSSEQNVEHLICKGFFYDLMRITIVSFDTYQNSLGRKLTI